MSPDPPTGPEIRCLRCGLLIGTVSGPHLLIGHQPSPVRLIEGRWACAGCGQGRRWRRPEVGKTREHPPE